MDPNTQRLFEAAAGGAAGFLGVEDVFNTWLYTGNASTQTITNGIDLSGEGGLVWIKQRNTAVSPYTGLEFNCWHDSARASTQYRLRSDSTQANQSYSSGYVSSFNSDGFTLDQGLINNTSSDKYASWTFRKAPGFFDVVTYTGTGSDQTISHNLGSTPGCIIVKRTDTTSDWYVYHRSLPTATENWIRLNNTGAANGAIGQDLWGPPTDTTFKVDTYLGLSTSGGTYVAYLFAHDAGGFGEDETESVIKCGTFTTDGSYNGSVTLGWEPQWVMVKNANATGGWFIHDTMRGAPVDGDSAWLYANASNVEASSSVAIRPNATGFTSFNHSANTDMIYIAIRRGPMKTPTDATDVFAADFDSASSTIPTWDSGFPVDMAFAFDTLGGSGAQISSSRLVGSRGLQTSSSAAEYSDGSLVWDSNLGWGKAYSVNRDYISWMFRRAPGFFDVVAYTGTGVARTVDHNLGVAPELMIIKKRNGTTGWAVYHQALGASKYLFLHSNGAEGSSSTFFNATTPTASSFSVGTSTYTNASSDTYIAYLFASVAGISKVGSYTGTGSTLNVDCGFTAGARFVLIKRSDTGGTGDWYVWDSVRGITSGNDPYLLLNSTAAEVTGTNYIDTLSSGFQITSSAPAAINASGGSFIFLAVA